MGCTRYVTADIMAFLLISLTDIATLRDDYHICGILTGTLPHLAQQNVFLGLPLMLIPEEVVLLVEKSMSFHSFTPMSDSFRRDRCISR